MAGRQGAPISNGFSVSVSEADLESGCSGAGDANGGDETQPLLSSSRGTESSLETERNKQQKHIATVQARLAVYQETEDALAKKYREEKEARAKAGRDYLEQTARAKAGRDYLGQTAPAAAGSNNLAQPTPAAAGSSNLAQPTPAAAGSNNLAQPTQPENPQRALKGNHFNLVKNLVFIENSPIHKKALEDWKGKEKLFKLRVERKSSEVSSLKNEVYQLLGFFSVFQGVVLTAVAQSNLLHCNNQWSPITLSVLASVVTVAAIIQKLFQINSLLNIVHTEQNCLKDVVKLENALRREGPDFVFAQFDEPKNVEPKQEWIFWLYSGIVVCFLAIFSVAFPVSYWRILCHPGSAPGGTSPSPAR